MIAAASDEDGRSVAPPSYDDHHLSRPFPIFLQACAFKTETENVFAGNIYNRGRKSNLYFYREGKGNEVDLILELGPDLFPIEIKAGETITPDYFKGLKLFRKIIGDLPWGAGLIYGGLEQQMRSDTRIFPAYDLEEMLNGIKESPE